MNLCLYIVVDSLFTHQQRKETLLDCMFVGDHMNLFKLLAIESNKSKAGG